MCDAPPRDVLIAMARRFGLRQDDSEDVIQDALVAALQAEIDFEAFVSAAANDLRRQRDHCLPLDSIDETSPTPDDDLSVLAQSIRDSADLSPRQNEVLDSYLAGNTQAETGAALGISHQAVSRTLSRAKRSLRNVDIHELGF